jgi:peptide/nickel transport system permease protein
MIFRKKKTEISGSLNYLAWQRFKRNKLSMAGLIFILLSALIAVLGYIVTPDKSSFANNQILEISTRKPGFSVQMLKVRKNETQNSSGVLNTMLFGRIDQYNYIPLNSFRFEKDKIIIEEFNDIIGEEPFYSEINLADVIFPLKYSEKILLDNNHLQFTLIDGNKESIDIHEAQKE